MFIVLVSVGCQKRIMELFLCKSWIAENSHKETIITMKLRTVYLKIECNCRDISVLECKHRIAFCGYAVLGSDDLLRPSWHENSVIKNFPVLHHQTSNPNSLACYTPLLSSLASVFTESLGEFYLPFCDQHSQD